MSLNHLEISDGFKMHLSRLSGYNLDSKTKKRETDKLKGWLQSQGMLAWKDADTMS